MIDALLKKFCRWIRYCAWSDGSIWLSLDRFDRFWPDAGLAFENGDAVKSAVREALRAKYAMDAVHRARVAINPDAPMAMEYKNRIQTLPKGCITKIVETAGMPDAECFARWILGPVYKAVGQPSACQSWSPILYHLSKEEPDMLASQYKVASDTSRKIVDIAARHRSEIDAIKERTEAAARDPLMGWDAVAYAEYQRAQPEANPLIGVRLYLTRQSFNRAWDDILACTNRADTDALSRWHLDFHSEHGYTIPNHADIIPYEVHGPY